MASSRSRLGSVSLVFAVSLVASAAAALLAPTASAATTRVLTIGTSTAHPAQAFGAFDGDPPKLFDFNGDGKLEIIAQNDNQYVYVFDSKNGALLAEIKTNFPPGWGARSINGPEAAALTLNGVPHLILANSAAVITSYRFDQIGSDATHFKFVKEWERRLTDCYYNPGMDSKPVFADLDKDGHLEIIAATEEFGIYALRDNGALYWKNCLGGGNADPAIGDLNGDGWPDVVYGSDEGYVYDINGRTGGIVWSYNILAHFNVGSASIPVGPGIGQLDGVGGPDVVVGARDSHDAVDWSNDHALLLALSSSGKLLWGRQDSLANPLTYTHPVIVDANADGRNEVYWGDWNTIGHKPPPPDDPSAWKSTGPAHFYRYAADGTMVWRQTLGTFWSNKDIAVAAAGSGTGQVVLANGPGTNGHDGIWYLDTATGAKLAFVDTYPWQVTRGPIVGDLWNTGTMQWIVPVASQYAATPSFAILVYDTGRPYDALWPHLPYPTLAPAPPPPPPGASFNATFTIKSPNAWWEELYVTPVGSHTIASAQVRIAGGSWKPMTKSSWGAWTSSYNAPAGTSVDFLVTDTLGGQSQSAVFTWLDGTLSRGSVPVGSSPPSPPPPPPPPPANTTFEPTASINNWWVEVKVRTSDPLSGVDARVNGGAWVPLSATSWGTWAKSFYVATGATVQFRATTIFSTVTLSQDFTWLTGGVPASATFKPITQTNPWWVEVSVTSSVVIVRVDVSIANGTWISLPADSWGTWAKSIHVAHQYVRFRATDDASNTAFSGYYLWG